MAFKAFVFTQHAMLLGKVHKQELRYEEYLEAVCLGGLLITGMSGVVLFSERGAR